MRLSTTPGLFLETLHTVSDILEQNADREPYGGLARAIERKCGGRNISVAVYRGAPDIEVDHFTVRFESGRFELIGRGRTLDIIDWRIPHAFLEDVVDNQDLYRANPEQMDLACLEALAG